MTPCQEYAEQLCPMIECLGSLLPFACEKVFDLAADIERYPEYVPGYISARIGRRDLNTYHVSQDVGYGPLRYRFSSVARLHRSTRIDITSTDTLFRQFQVSWVVEIKAPGTCRAKLEVEVEMRSFFLQQTIGPRMAVAVADSLAAFERRAYAKCANPLVS